MPKIEFDESFSLSQKIALVTGAASGIGLEISRMFARKGAEIIAFDMADTRELGEYVAGLGRKFWSFQGDITSSDDVNKAVQGALDFYGRIDILINCVGVGLIDYAENLSEEIWDKTMDINLKGTFLMSQAVGRSMIKNGGGKIVSIASQAGVTAMEKHLAYGVSKAGIIYMTKLLGYEWAKYNIRVNAISPTIILTPLGERVWDNPDGEAMKARIPINRFGMPNEVAASALFLASDAADLITGENLVIDGGFSIYQGV